MTIESSKGETSQGDVRKILKEVLSGVAQISKGFDRKKIDKAENLFNKNSQEIKSFIEGEVEKVPLEFLDHILEEIEKACTLLREQLPGGNDPDLILVRESDDSKVSSWIEKIKDFRRHVEDNKDTKKRGGATTSPYGGTDEFIKGARIFESLSNLEEATGKFTKLPDIKLDVFSGTNASGRYEQNSVEEVAKVTVDVTNGKIIKLGGFVSTGNYSYLSARDGSDGMSRLTSRRENLVDNIEKVLENISSQLGK